MAGKPIVFALVQFLHDLFTAVWVGGLIALVFSVLPASRKVLGAGPQTKKLMRAIQDRQSLLVYVSMVGLVLTGVLQANRTPEFQGLFSFANPYSQVLAVKHILTAAMVVVALYRTLVLGRKEGGLSPSQEKLSVGLLFVNAGLGVVILLLSGFAAALSAG